MVVVGVAEPEATAAPQDEASSPSGWHRFAESPSGEHVAASPVGPQPTDARLLVWRSLAPSAVEQLLNALADSVGRLDSSSLLARLLRVG